MLGVVGESGSVKSVTAQSIMRLIPEPPGKIVDGRIQFDGMNLLEATLSFLGVGVPLTEPSIGMMIAIGKNYIYAGM